MNPVAVFCAGAIVAVAAALPPQESRSIAAPTGGDDPLAAFATMVGGRWKMTTVAKSVTHDVWSWGPGRRSIRRMGDGRLPDGDPWRTVAVFYRRPDDVRVRWLTLQSVARGVGEGVFAFDGTKAEGSVLLHQTGGRRELGLRWTFDGPDRYRDELLEKGPVGFEPMTAWDRIRVPEAAPDELRAAASLPWPTAPSERLRPLERFLGRAWTSDDAAASTRPAAKRRTRATVQYVPFADAAYVRVEQMGAAGAAGAADHAADLYLFHHTGARALRFLLLTVDDAGRGRVFEGDCSPSADGRALDLRIQEPRANGVATYEARLDLPIADAFRLRVWNSTDRAGPTTLDVRYRREAE